MKPSSLIVALCLLLVCSSCKKKTDTVVQPASTISHKSALSGKTRWMYQLQSLNIPSRLIALANTEYPLLVIEPGFNLSTAPYDTQSIVNQLRTTPLGQRRTLLAYIDIGQAENYRDYWKASWIAPTTTSVGSPSYLLSIDPDQWSGNFQVSYWNPAWKNLWLGPTGIIAKIANYGIDGVYLDWVGAYGNRSVQKAGQADGVNVANEMITFIEEIRVEGRKINPKFLVVPQNAPYLIDTNPTRYSAAIDGLAVEDTWFSGAGDATWDSPLAGDIAATYTKLSPRTELLLQYEKYTSLGLPVFSVDYCISPSNATQVYVDSKAAGLVPLVTRVSLDRLSVTPPPVN